MAAPRKLTLTERQLQALYSIAYMEVSLGARLGLLKQREPVSRPAGGEWPDATDETHLSADEMRDLRLRLAEYLYPYELADHPVEVEVVA